MSLCRTPWWRRSPIVGALLVVATLLVYFPAWHGEAVFDDDDHLTPPELSSIHGLARIWTEVGAVSQYYPITHSVFWLENRLWGHDVLGYHLVNILLHASAALLLVSILKRLALPGAWLAGAIFALHPVHAEAVAWISELKNTLSTTFYLGAALAYLRFDQTRHRSPYVVALLLFVAALLSKTVTASLPAALLVIFWWKRGRLSWKSDIQPLLPFVAFGIGAGILTAWVERTFIGAEGHAFAITNAERVLIAGRAFWFYLGKLIWPADLIFVYPRWHLDTTAWRQHLFPAAALIVVTALWLHRHRSRGPLAATLFFAGTLFPVLGFLNVYPFIYSFVADHYQYLASLGVIAAFAAGISLLLIRFGLFDRPIGSLLCIAALSVFATLTWRQSRMYRDTETLWQVTLARNPACFVAHSNLGNFYLQQGRVDEAIRHTQMAMDLRPDFAEIHNNLGTAFREKGRDEDALAQFQKAVELRPSLAVAHYNIGALYFQQGRIDDAATQFKKAVELRPDYVKAQNNLGSILLDQGRVSDAEIHIRKALETRPDDTDAQTNLGNILLRKGQIDEAITLYQSVLGHHPDDPVVLTNLGAALLQSGRTDEAINRLERAIEQDPSLAQSRHLLGNAFLQRGEPDKAAVQLTQAVTLQPNLAEALNNLGIALAQTGHADAAMEQFEKALAAQPNFAEAHNNIGRIFLQNGNARAAIDHFRASLKTQPDDPDTLANLSWILSVSPDPTLRDGTQAATLAQRANQNSGGENPFVLRSLAAAYAESGQLNDAVSTARRAIQLSVAQGDETLAADLRAHLTVYSSGSAIRDQMPAVRSPQPTSE